MNAKKIEYEEEGYIDINIPEDHKQNANDLTATDSKNQNNPSMNVNKNFTHLNSNKNLYDLYSNDFDNTMNNLIEKKICPYYYFLNLLQISNPDIIICTVSDFFDLKKRIQITELLKSCSNMQNFKLVLDESCEILNQITFNYSMNIDESLLLNASNQLFILKESYLEKENSMKEYEENYKHLIDDLNENEENLKMYRFNFKTENEFLLFNGMSNFHDINLNSKLLIPGIIRKPIHFLNLISRLISFFKNYIFNPIKTENVWNIYTFQQQLLKELWLDFRSLKFLLGRFILLLNEIRWENYEK